MAGADWSGGALRECNPRFGRQVVTSIAALYIIKSITASNHARLQVNIISTVSAKISRDLERRKEEGALYIPDTELASQD